GQIVDEMAPDEAVAGDAVAEDGRQRRLWVLAPPHVQAGAIGRADEALFEALKLGGHVAGRTINPARDRSPHDQSVGDRPTGGQTASDRTSSTIDPASETSALVADVVTDVV